MEKWDEKETKITIGVNSLSQGNFYVSVVQVGKTPAQRWLKD